MMYLINYDLYSPGKDYSPLIQAIQAFGSWAKISRSCWMIRSDHTAVQIRNSLSKHLDGNDTLFVCSVGTWAAHNISSEVVNWLND